MDTIQLVVYVVASFLAIRSLSSLMTHHRQSYFLTRLQEVKVQVDQAARQEEAARMAAEAQAAQQNNGMPADQAEATAQAA